MTVCHYQIKRSNRAQIIKLDGSSSISVAVKTDFVR